MEMSLFSVPSSRKLFERPRAPLTTKVAVPNKPRLLLTPGTVSAKATGLRPETGIWVIFAFGSNWRRVGAPLPAGPGLRR